MDKRQERTRSGESSSQSRESVETIPVDSQQHGARSLIRRFGEDVDRLFGGFFGSRDAAPGDALGRSPAIWWPEVDVSHSANKLVVKADLPGLKKEDLRVEVRDNDLCISGERRSESEQNEGHVYRSERSYGAFCRTISLPQGAQTDHASATFENGVLRIEIEAPRDEQQRTRRIEVREGNPH
ncbi:MAG TPA: Hsp20/alpha crystallin family protein [Polyangiaceae bacterium]|jgi:HSP20 family protein